MRLFRKSTPAGFTLVELLVVIAIIGILIALLLPAVQAAREAARRSQCQNHLRQIGLAVLNYHDVEKVFPMGRNRTDQRGISWAFRVLPFLEEETIHRSHQPNLPSYHSQNAITMRTPIPVYACPSRRQAAADRDFDNDDERPVVRAAASLGDYCASAGHEYSAGTEAGIFASDADAHMVGPIYSFSSVPARKVVDGLSSTLAVGERHIPEQFAYPNRDLTDYIVGDTAFLPGDLPRTIMCGTDGGIGRDPVDLSLSQFGSAHPDVVQFVYLDGHVDAVGESIEQNLLEALATISGGEIAEVGAQ